MHKILVIGAVNSTAKVIEKLIEHELTPSGIIGYNPDDISKVSKWFDLSTFAKKHNINFKGFKNINDPSIINWAKSKEPDIIFAVGFSQLLKREWLDMPKLGCIGFHPTKLPEGRGRAPIAWMILEQKDGAATFFLMGEGADDGPIFIQESFNVQEFDDANSLEKKILESIGIALDKWLPRLKREEWDPKPQDHSKATWYGKRSPSDGLINWNNSAFDIDRLIKATTFPHPGAYSFIKDKKVIILNSQIEKILPVRGVVGKVLDKDKQKGVLIQCGKGLLWVKNLVNFDESNISIGSQFGYNLEEEIHNLLNNK